MAEILPASRQTTKASTNRYTPRARTPTNRPPGLFRGPVVAGARGLEHHGLWSRAKTGVFSFAAPRLARPRQPIENTAVRQRPQQPGVVHTTALRSYVQGLANAEEEVFSLKAKAEELERQRDHYKALLAKTNSELDVSRAHAQISQALGEPAGSSSSGGGAGGGDDATIRRSARKGGGETAAAGGKGKAPARRSQRRRPGDGTEARATSGGDSDGGSVGDSPPAAAAAAKNNNGGGGNSRGSSTVWRGARIAVPEGGGAAAGRGSSRKREARPPAAAAAATIGGGVAAASAAASTRAGSNKRPREAMETAADARGRDQPGSVIGGDNTKDVEEEEEGGRQGEGADGVSSAAEGGIGRRQGDGVGDRGGRGADGSDGGGGGGDPESDYDSDNAPSMFF